MTQVRQSARKMLQFGTSLNCQSLIRGDCAAIHSQDNNPLEGHLMLVNNPPQSAYYEATGYGAGSHEDKSYSSSAPNEGADFTLRYTISLPRTVDIRPTCSRTPSACM